MPRTTAGTDISGPDPAQLEPSGGVPSTTAQLQRFGRTYPAVGRAAVSVVCAAAAPFAGAPVGAGITAVVAVGVVAWHLALLVILLPVRPTSRGFGWVYAVDVPAKCVLCVAQPLFVAPELLATSRGWVAPIVSFALVNAQFTLRPLPAAVATVAMPAAFVAGVALSPGLTVVDGLLLGGGWMLVVAVLARLVWVLLLRGAHQADRVLQARFTAERDAETAAARRAGQRAHWATVHDTSASTLLMIGLGGVSGTERWLPGQVRRDIALLDGRPATDDGAADLGERLRAVAGRAHVHVRSDCPTGVSVPSPVADAVAGAAAEALENVRRHAGTGAATLTLRVDRGGSGAVVVEVADRGRGFEPADVAPHRFGLARSVHERMNAVGGVAEVESAPQYGTVVRLWWADARVPRSVAPAYAEPYGDDRTPLARALLRALRVGQSVIVLTILLGHALPNVLATLYLYRPPWTGLAWLAALVAVAVADAVLVARHRSWGAARWPVAVVVLAISAWATALLPAPALVGPAHQTLTLVGWFGVLLFGERGIRPLVGFLAAHVGITLVQLGAAGRLDGWTLVNLVLIVAVAAGFQLTAGAAAASLTRLAATATDAAHRQAATLTADAVAQQLHADREERYARLRESVLPLLRGVGDGSLSPADPDVQRRAAVEAARMRRLFAEESDVRDPLAAELGALVDVVERRGTDVRFSARGQWPVPPPAVCRALVEEVGAALLAAHGSARVTMGPAGAGVAVSVVADGETAPRRPRAANAGGITTVTVIDDERTWVEARWTPTS
jgi:hypothetical protein